MKLDITRVRNLLQEFDFKSIFIEELGVNMPPAYVNTIREEILYEYAKLISRSAYGTLQRGFVTDRFKKLRDGEILFPAPCGSGNVSRSFRRSVFIVARKQS